MTVSHDPMLCARLIAEAHDDDASMLPATWVAEDDELYSDSQRMGTVQVAGFTQDADEECQRGIARTRNNLRDLADQLEAACADAATWREMYQSALGTVHAENDALRAEVAKLRDIVSMNAACADAEWRGKREEQIDAIADALGDESEWSNLSDRGDNALEAATSIVAERDKLRAEVARLTAAATLARSGAAEAVRDADAMRQQDDADDVRRDIDAERELDAFWALDSTLRAILPVYRAGIRWVKSTPQPPVQMEAANVHRAIRAAMAIKLHPEVSALLENLESE